MGQIIETSSSVMLEMREAEVKQLRQQLAKCQGVLDQYDIYIEALKTEVDRLKGILQLEYCCDDMGSGDCDC